ncbi:MAG TPA: HYR domain-containing protein, partial [Methylomirabilota bacterium]|nr:HYR domain-containing protein [Methylomirabilota bacterium]
MKVMKALLALFTSTACLITVCDRAVAQSTPPEALFMTTNLIPPPNGIYVAAPGSRVDFPNGIVLSNILIHDVIPGFTPPSAGLSVTHTFRGWLDVDISFDHGTNFVHSAASNICSINLQGMSPDNSGVQSYDTEMLQLDISGGNLPAVMIRESPTLRSSGHTQISPTPGGFRVSSFFDVFTELSLDGGRTWIPAVQATHIDLRVDPAQIPPTTEPAPLMPPLDDQYVSLGQGFTFNNGLVLKDMRLKFFSQGVDPTGFGLGTSQIIGPVDAKLDCQLSTDGGQSFSAARIGAQLTFTLRKIDPGSPFSGPHPWPWIVYDTEMLQLDLSGGDLPVNLRLRESPTLPSYGETGIIPQADGTYQISSFFDIFTEASTDGGQTWAPQNAAPGHLELQRPGFQYQYSSPNQPPASGSYLAGSQSVGRYNNTSVVISNLTLSNFAPSAPPPPIGPPVEAFTCTASFTFSLNGGQSFTPGSAPATASVAVNGSQSYGVAQFYNTELLQLDITGGTLPPALRIRESPTKASLGRMSITPTQPASPIYRIDSFFDIFTEVSLDGGQSWASQITSPIAIALVPLVPPIARLGVICPSDISVFTGDPSGAYVNYSLPPQLFPDCPFGPFTITCVPASGSKFPLGTTTVHCTRTDGCGETATCSFKVTVTQNFIYYAGLAHSVIGNANLTLINTGAQPSLVISNLGSGGNDGFHL